MASASATTIALFSISLSFSAALWDGLGVFWNKDVTKFPAALPRTTAEAKEQGWYQEDKLGCSAPKGYKGLAWHHLTYYPSLNLLFDVNGYIAGVQVGLEYSQVCTTGYPIYSQSPPFILEPIDSGSFVISVYFIEPSKICVGRTEQEFMKQGTGNDVYIQNGSSVIKAPKYQRSATAPWVEGMCRFTLGHHYWYGVNENTRAEDYFPIFLLYNGGELNGFGFYFIKEFRGPVYESCNNFFCPLYMKSIPQAFETESFSVVHVFLDKDPSLNFC